MILLLYVDDILLTGSSLRLLNFFITKLGAEFDIKDLGDLHYFLGIVATRDVDGLHLSQTKYTLDLLRRCHMLDCKPSSTPVAPRIQLSAFTGDPISDPSEYRHILGALQYLTITRPDTAFAVHHLAQFTSNPTNMHLVFVVMEYFFVALLIHYSWLLIQMRTGLVVQILDGLLPVFVTI